MSSHHFVRENQEPALFILRLESLHTEVIGELLEWVPTVVATQEVAEKLASHGIKIDAVVAELPLAIPLNELVDAQFPLTLVDREGRSPLVAGLEFMIRAGQKAVNLIGLDHREAFLLEPYLEQLDLVLFDGPLRYFPVKDPSFKKWVPGGSIQLHGRENSFVEVSTEQESTVHQIRHATFLEVEEGTIRLQSTELFWVGEFFVSGL
ncbi:MAG: thiamine pyrophosphokinase [Lunatimonas sp.]|uniref:thiamine pyrophosphokinase n=1 Tax=Lunatimonas sp. TaxID=2060141 RepID=UPI00263B526B|nr:thiamine pyrophosphokinase [Lunatimonas sp.]MCC5937697.1 thiamine pyrophosphokinase [Lunatimonas sp.]